MCCLHEYTDEPMLNWILNNEVEKLQKQGVDINSDNYHEHPKFQKLADGYIYGLGMHTDWALEKYVVGQKRLEQIFGCYSLKVTRALTSEESKNIVWYKSLADKYKELSRTSKDIYHYFNRNKDGRYGDKRKGLIGRLKDWGLDVDAFSDKSEYVRLLYFLYCFEVENKIQLFPFLNHPTLENVDNSLVGDRTKNGYLIAELKKEVEQGISAKFITRVKKQTSSIALTWQNDIEALFMLVGYSGTDSNLNRLQRADAIFCDEINVFRLDCSKCGKYRHSLLETFYLKLVQHELIGRVADIIDVAQDTRDYLPEVTMYNPEEYRELGSITVEWEKVSEYIKTNEAQLMRLVFRKDKISGNEKQKFYTAAKKVPQYLEMLNNNSIYCWKNGTIVLHIIIVIQDIIEMTKTDTIDNHFYGYQTSDQRSLSAELKKGSGAFRKNQIAWIFRIRYRAYAYTGRLDKAKLAQNIEYHIDSLLRKIYQCNSIQDMQFLHNFFHGLLDAALVSEKHIESAVEYFFDMFPEEYNFGGIWRNINLFFGMIPDSYALVYLKHRLSTEILTANQKGRRIRIEHTLNLINSSLNQCTQYDAVFIIDPVTNIIHFDFYVTPKSECAQRLAENGLSPTN